MPEPATVAPEIVEALRSICLALPDVREEQAWVGTRWRIGGRTFAHVLTVDGGWPPAYARAAGTDGPLTVLMFRSSGDELDVLRRSGPPFFAPPWRADEVGMAVTADADWTEVAELLTESWCAMAPPARRAEVTRPPD